MVLSPESLSADVSKEPIHYAHEYCDSASPESMMEDFVTGHRNVIPYGYADISAIEFDDEQEREAVCKKLKCHPTPRDTTWYLGKDDKLGMIFQHVLL